MEHMLNQSETWVDSKGTPLPIEDMDPYHAANAHAMMRRTADGARLAKAAYSLPSVHLLPLQDTSDVKQRPGDEHDVYLVTSGAGEDYTVESVFVGNRPAAYRYAAEFNRQGVGLASVEAEFDAAVGVVAAREYAEPYTRVTYTTQVSRDTGTVLTRPVNVRVSQDGDPTVRVDTAHSDEIVVVETSGPDHLLGEIRKTHRERINRVRRRAASTGGDR